MLIGNEGEDELLDRVIASRSPGRRIGTKLCHPRPYQRLLQTINASPDLQPRLLADFLRHWYEELNRPPKPGLSEMTAMYDRPYRYTYGNNGLRDSGYLGSASKQWQRSRRLDWTTTSASGMSTNPAICCGPTDPSLTLCKVARQLIKSLAKGAGLPVGLVKE